MHDPCDSFSPKHVVIATGAGLMVIAISIVFNLSMFLMIMLNRNLLKMSNIYIVILSVSNSLIAIVYFFYIASMFYRTWLFGNMMCKGLAYSIGVCTQLSGLIVLLICYDRYVKIFQIKKLKIYFKKMIWLILGAVLISVIFPIPMLFMYHVSQLPCNKAVFLLICLDLPLERFRNLFFKNIFSNKYVCSFRDPYYFYDLYIYENFDCSF